MRNRRLIWIAVVVGVVGALAYWLTRHEVPTGQPPLVHLSLENLSTLRGDFNRAAGETRIILLLSPT